MSDFRSFKYINYDFDKINKNPISVKKQFQGAELTYGKDEKVSLFLFLPHKESSLEEFYTELNYDNLERWLKQFYYSSGFISIPKFKMKLSKELNNNLISLGMKTAFIRGGDNFPKMGIPTGNGIYIGKVNHDSFIDVNEEGTEAAAVTTVTMNTQASSEPTLSVRFVADRPFFYLIRDNETKSILFMGAVNNPEYEDQFTF